MLVDGIYDPDEWEGEGPPPERIPGHVGVRLKWSDKHGRYVVVDIYQRPSLKISDLIAEDA